MAIYCSMTISRGDDDIKLDFEGRYERYDGWMVDPNTVTTQEAGKTVFIDYDKLTEDEQAKMQLELEDELHYI